MSEFIEIGADIKEFLYDILSRNNLSLNSEITYTPGSEVGDGYGSKTIAVDVKDGDKYLHLFLKCALSMFSHETFRKIYATEILFYKTIVPTYQRFLKERNVEDDLSYIPRCYGVFEKTESETVALENLRKRNFTLFDKSKCMDDKHLELILKTFAGFHGISFGMKDQRKEVHDKFCEDRPNIFISLRMLAFDNIIGNIAKEFLEKLDPGEDADILDRCDNLDLKIKDQLMNMNEYLSEYSILTKGDCWVNNMMLLYKDESCDDPLDVMLIDWQGVTRASPVHDIGGIFYSVSSEETLDNYKYYLEFYHDELSRRIKELGSNPEILYPFSVFETDWKKYALYNLGISLLMVKLMVCKKENIPVIDQGTPASEVAEATVNFFTSVSDGEEQFLRRIKYIIRHFMIIGVL